MKKGTKNKLNYILSIRVPFTVPSETGGLSKNKKIKTFVRQNMNIYCDDFNIVNIL